jgi:hypothetical protein
MIMKKVLMVLVAAMLMMGITTGGHAALTFKDCTASFYLVDSNITGSFDNTIVMSALTNGDITSLQYRYGDEDWANFDATGTVRIPTSLSSHTQLVYLRYVDDISATEMIFQGGTDHFTGLYIDFGNHIFDFNSVARYDTFAPVPISPSVYLLGAGLIGLVGLRKRFQQ